MGLVQQGDIGGTRERHPELVPDFVRDMPQAQDAIALFDADGTLYEGDVADDFTLWMIRQGHIQGDLWQAYANLVATDLAASCAFLLRLYRGYPARQLRQDVTHYWRSVPPRQFIPEVVEALFTLAAKGYRVFVVSGTPTEILRPLKEVLPVEDVIGMEFEVGPDGCITGNVAGTPSVGRGKVARALKQAPGHVLAFAAGNSTLDVAMLEAAQKAWVIHPPEELERLAKDRGWHVLPRS